MISEYLLLTSNACLIICITILFWKSYRSWSHWKPSSNINIINTDRPCLGSTHRHRVSLSKSVHCDIYGSKSTGRMYSRYTWRNSDFVQLGFYVIQSQIKLSIHNCCVCNIWKCEWASNYNSINFTIRLELDQSFGTFGSVMFHVSGVVHYACVNLIL